LISFQVVSFADQPFLFRYIPIIASVSEHQPTAWPAFFMDLQLLIFMFPAGVILCFRELRDEHVFVIIYAVMASYFAGVMVRLMLTLTPVVCVSAAVAFSSLFDAYIDPTEPSLPEEASQPETSNAGSTAAPPSASKKAKKAAAAAAAAHAPTNTFEDIVAGVTGSSSSTKKGSKGIFGLDTRLAVIVNALCMLLFFVFHCTWVTASAYSSPSVVLASHNQDGSQNIIDDFREAYYWLRQNTPETAVVMSWWDYGYQIAGMADRPTLVDNNTWNNSELDSSLRHWYLAKSSLASPHRNCW
jgi:dolichyl-diphosphooligosaccharide---protein glycosyltransferase